MSRSKVIGLLDHGVNVKQLVIDLANWLTDADCMEFLEANDYASFYEEDEDSSEAEDAKEEAEAAERTTEDWEALEEEPKELGAFLNFLETKVPKGYPHVAQDSDGEWFAYMVEPLIDELENGSWVYYPAPCDHALNQHSSKYLGKGSTVRGIGTSYFPSKEL